MSLPAPGRLETCHPVRRTSPPGPRVISSRHWHAGLPPRGMRTASQTAALRIGGGAFAGTTRDRSPGWSPGHLVDVSAVGPSGRCHPGFEVPDEWRSAEAESGPLRDGPGTVTIGKDVEGDLGVAASPRLRPPHQGPADAAPVGAPGHRDDMDLGALPATEGFPLRLDRDQADRFAMRFGRDGLGGTRRASGVEFPGREVPKPIRFTRITRRCGPTRHHGDRGCQSCTRRLRLIDQTTE